MRFETLIVLIVVFASVFSSLLAVTLGKEQSVWAVWSCIYVAVISIALASFKIGGIFLLGGDFDWHEVLLVERLLRILLLL